MTPAARATALLLAVFAAAFVVAAVAAFRLAVRGLIEEDLTCATAAGTTTRTTSARGCGWTASSTLTATADSASRRSSQPQHLKAVGHQHRLTPHHEWLLWTVSVVVRFYRWEDGGPKTGVVLASLFLAFAVLIGANQ